jgi:alpha-ribazole phosphatase
MITTVLLVRHGQTRSNTTGYYMGRSNEDLDDTGYTQVRRLSKRLAAIPIASVYSSPLQRTFSTALAIAEPHGLEVEILDDLIEIHLGDWQGLHKDEILQTWPGLWRRSRLDVSDVAMPKGESFRQVAERAARAFQRIVEVNRGKQVLLVTHEVMVKMLATHALSAPISIYRRFEIGNASLSVVKATRNKALLCALNDTSHLNTQP